MKFVMPNAVLIDEKDPFKKIELAGRTCYKSEAKITPDSAKTFVGNMIGRGHTAMLEHCVFTFMIYPKDGNLEFFEDMSKYALHIKTDKYIIVTKHKDRILASANLRAICQRGENDPIFRAVQNIYPSLAYGNALISASSFENVCAEIVNINDINDLTDFEKDAHTYYTFRITTDRGVTHELVRHRPVSYAQESTRYVNYRDGLSISFPAQYEEKDSCVQAEYERAFCDAETHYQRLIEMGEKPQQARAVLPNALKTEIVVTTNLAEWKHILDLRYFGTTGAPHPDIKEVMRFVCEVVTNGNREH